MTRSRSIFIATVALLAAAAVATPPPRPADFGQRWVRQHPLTLMGLQSWPHTLRLDLYRGAGLNNVLAWWADGHGDEIAAAASAQGIPWHALIVDGEGEESARIQRYAMEGNAAGWMLGDELNRQQMPFFGSLSQWTKQNRPNELIYTNAYPTYAGDAGLYGGTPPAGGYSYSQYLEDMIQIVQPDVLMYDHYPFLAGGGRRGDYFANLMAVRNKAHQRDLPYWAFIQSWKQGGYRLPSESDVRMQLFSHLTAGYTGIAYFTFDHFGEVALLDSAGNPSPLYPVVADLNPEVERLGNALRFMTNNATRFVQGHDAAGGGNPTPQGLGAWTRSAGGDAHILDIDVTQAGLGKDGMIGLFTDDDGDRAFMLTNLHHGEGLSSQATELEFVLWFDSSINEVLRLNRETGLEELIPLTNHQLRINIPGGTGELFKYNEGSFLVPEPGAMPLLFSAAICWCSRRKRARGISR